MAVALAKQVKGRWKTISYWDSYHGNGFQAASVGGEEHFTSGMGPMVPGAYLTMRPALCITKDECDWILDALEKALARIVHS